MAACAARMTHIGIENSRRYPAATRRPAIIPIVFWASLVPCPRLYAAADSSCSRRNHLSTRAGRNPRNIHSVMIEMMSPRPMTGDMTINTRVFVHPEGMSDSQPALAIAAPAYPPTSACDELVGRPMYHVIRSHKMAPSRPCLLYTSDAADERSS